MSVKELGEIIKQRRKALAMSQSQLAEYTGLSVVTLSQIENGKANPAYGTLDEIFHFLSLEITVKVKA